MKKKIFRCFLAGVIVMVTFLTGCESLSVTEMESLKFYVGNEKSLRISTQNGSVSLTGWDNNYISVEARKSVSGMKGENELRDLLKKVEIVTVANGANASVLVDFPDELTGFLDGGVGFGASLDVFVPNQFEYVNIDTSNGKIDINGIDSEMSADTSNGSLNLSNFKGMLDLDTSNGAVRLNKVELSDGRNIIKTSNGSISGDIILPENGSVICDTSNGRVDLSVPSNSRAYLEADTSNGSVSVRGIKMEIIDESKSDLTAELNGGGISFKIDSSNGNITINGN